MVTVVKTKGQITWLVFMIIFPNVWLGSESYSESLEEKSCGFYLNNYNKDLG